jgi:hypothetical protein
MASNSKGPVGIRVGKNSSNNTISNMTYEGPGTAIEIEKGSTGNTFEDITVAGGAEAIRYVDHPRDDPRPTGSRAPQSTPNHSKGWSRAFEANYPFKNKKTSE